MEETNLIHQAATILLSAFGAFLMALVGVYGRRLALTAERRLGIDIPDELEAEATRVAYDAISYAEEWGRGKAKELGKHVLSSAKLNQAAAYFRDHASDRVIAWTRDKVEEYISAKLGQARVIEATRRAVPQLPAPILSVPSAIDPERTPHGTANP